MTCNESGEILERQPSGWTPEEEGELLVATADGNGVPMRRPPELRVHRGPRRAKGENAHKKQMAYVGAVYTIDRFCRTADDVLDEVLRKQRAIERTAPQHKQVWAKMTSEHEQAACSGRICLSTWPCSVTNSIRSERRRWPT